MKTIHVIVDNQGKITLETSGFVGGQCREASRFLEVALGQECHESLKPEFHQQDSTGLRLQQPS